MTTPEQESDQVRPHLECTKEGKSIADPSQKAQQQYLDREPSRELLELRRTNRQLIITARVVGVAIIAAFIAFMITVVSVAS